jgi:hypothetical protein
MKRHELIEGLTQDILTYVMHGTFPERHVAEELKPSELDERFNDYDSLIRLHFILRPEVVDFVESLPSHLRSLKTQTENVSTTTRGSVDGRIDWQSTVQKRYSRNPGDTALFVCENRSENYDIDENIVLKRLLAVIYTTLGECREYLQREYDWVTDRWQSNLELVDPMERIFERNVHVTRIRDPHEYEPTDRMLRRASESRNPVYRTAERLLRQYESALAGDTQAIRQLLEQTTITPDDDETLLELYVLFRYIEAVEAFTDDQFTLDTIESGSQEVARLHDGDREIVVYHDSSAPDRDLSFISDVFDKDDEVLSRTERIQREARRVADQYFVEEKFRNVTGRPDVIVLEIETENAREYVITEVKHSARAETIQQGIRETLEYLAFLRDDDELVHDESEAFGSGWNGVLVTQDFDGIETASLTEQRSMRIIQASELPEQLPIVLERVLGM